MEGDFTRSSDDASEQFSGVLMQQGRVQLDADWNEQWAIQTRALRSALADLIGPHGGPEGRLGFALAHDPAAKHITVSIGPYYVDGVRVEVGSEPFGIELGNLRLDGRYLGLLEVWDRHVSPVELPALREPALLGVDTTTRAQTVWSLKLHALSKEEIAQLQRGGEAAFAEAYVTQLKAQARPLLRAQAKLETERDPCAASPEARYRGHENQLYRVEIHQAPAPAPEGAPRGTPAPAFRFKWSRENGSVTFPVETVEGPETNESPATTSLTMHLGHLGRDARFGLVPGDVVELVDDAVTRPRITAVAANEPDRGSSGVLGIVREVRSDTRDVVVELHAGDAARIADKPKHPYLRRWDQRAPSPVHAGDLTSTRELSEGAIPVFDNDLTAGAWFELEQGVAVQFSLPSQRGEPGGALPPRPRGGDYWTIPARVVTGDVIWPRQRGPGASDEPTPLPPHGIARHLAPLALLTVKGTDVKVDVDLRKTFPSLAVPIK